MLLCIFPAPARPQAPDLIGWWGSMGTEPGQFRYPKDVAVASNGDVYVADTGNHRIQKFTNGGEFLLQWGRLGTGPGQFNEPSRLAMCPNGDVIVTDAQNRRLQRFTSSGAWLATFGQFPNSFPWGIAVSSSGVTHVSYYHASRIAKYSADNEFLQELWLLRAHQPTNGIDAGPDMVLDAADHMYVLASFGTGSYDALGTPLGEWGWGAAGLAIGPSGHLYGVNDRIVYETTTRGDLVKMWEPQPAVPGEQPVLYGVALDAQENVYLPDFAHGRVLKYGSLPVPAFRTSWGRIKALGAH